MSQTLGKRVVAAGAAAIALLLLAGCSSSGTASTGNEPKGSPIKIGLISDETSSTSIAYPEVHQAWMSMVDDANAHGGWNGHKIELVNCDDQLDANVATNCARKLASQGVVTMVTWSINGALQVMDIAAAQGIPYFPLWNIYPQELQNTDSYPIIIGDSVDAGMGAVAVDYCKDPAILVTEGNDAATDRLQKLVQSGWDTAGGSSDVALIKIAATATDYAPAVAEGKKYDCFISSLPPGNAVPFYAAMASAGAKQKIIGVGGSAISATFAKQAPTVLEGGISIDCYPPFPTAKVWSTYVSLLKKYSDFDKYPFGTQFSNYASFLTLKDAALSILKDGGTVDAVSVKKYLDSGATIDSGGLLPAGLSFSKPLGLPGAPRVINAQVTYNVIKKGQPVSLDGGKWHDMSDALKASGAFTG